MRMNEFFDFIEAHILEELGPEYQDAHVEIREVHKSNDVVMHGLTIAREDSVIVPVIYLEDFYHQYEDGMHVGAIMDRIAAIRKNAENPSFDINYKDFTDFDKVADRIHIRICDPELNQTRLESLITKDVGDFTATYYINLAANGDELGAVNVNQALMDSWGITPEQLHGTALANDMMNSPSLTSIQDLIENMMFDGEPPMNYLTSGETADIGSLEVPMFCLTNGDKMYGASLIINPSVQAMISDVVGGDYYVIPSSLHEVLIIPEAADISLEELSDMVVTVNSTEVSPQDKLSDKVQHFSAHTRVLENAQVYAEKVKETPELYGKTKDDPGKIEPLPSNPII